MSYCVNCGVELAPSEPRCPLCGVEVVNPADPWKEPRSRPYPAYVETVLTRVDKRYFSLVAALIATIPVVLCIIIDLLSSGEIVWSGYVAGSIGTLMTFVLVPMAVGKQRPFLYLTLDVLAVLGLLLYIDLASGGFDWFPLLGVPITLYGGVLVGVILLYFRGRKRSGILNALAVLVIGIGVYVIAVEICIRVYRGYSPVPHWSLYAFVPCLLTGVAFIVLNRRKKWKESVRKRLFF